MGGWGKKRQYVRPRDEVARETRAWKCERSETIDMKVSNYFNLLRLAVPRRHAHVTGGHMGVSRFRKNAKADELYVSKRQGEPVSSWNLSVGTSGRKTVAVERLLGWYFSSLWTSEPCSLFTFYFISSFNSSRR